MEDFSAGAVVRTDGVIVPARVLGRADGSCDYIDLRGGGPIGHCSANQEGVWWARGEWDSEAVVALRALAALRASC